MILPEAHSIGPTMNVTIQIIFWQYHSKSNQPMISTGHVE